ncbi:MULTISPECIES: ABC transporter ATP-binding protein [Parageobacillus]|jgi:branched-chain amino acid transport system ATP-binding protein|uniref:High-affinity branched-chain amino acid ABC transporter ATP-binding protein LivG n=1 Tax=Parageobacillus thermoglucosidasius TaxID=1426 RepID=A0A1B7KQ98_PARTM|nr:MULTISPECIES: ABC transporter ATP-binding protein [Parageobacillus]OAT72258.1 high-affinity branched-chain amino acid ABC transporter ATP-binding protein LivG [Parageobacillus thermoglucosidasius]BDG45937.1 ABC transporter ATP-binding protein [Parageobacillus sp. KH3-4]
MATSTLLLKADGVGIEFGGLKALSGVNIELHMGELVGLIGPNGAGKTTFFNLLTGVYEPTEGTIMLGNEKLNGLPPYKITRKGISRTFQNIRLFGELSVLDNVKVAYHSLARHSILSSIFRLPSHFSGEKEIEEKAIEFLKIFKLEHAMHEKAKNLPYGQQRRLEIARALAAHPKLLLLDEPAAGMNPQETQELMNLIAFIREKFHLTILLIEHDMSLVMGICERIYVLDHGQLIAHGTPEEIRNNPKVIEAYLGEEVS